MADLYPYCKFAELKQQIQCNVQIQRQHLRRVYDQGTPYVAVRSSNGSYFLDARKHADVLDYFKEVYGASWDYWHEERYRDRNGSEFNGWIEARRMYTLKPHAAAEH